MSPSPLPIRDGLDPTRLRLPEGAPATKVLDYLVTRFPRDAARLRHKVGAGEVVDKWGNAVDETTVLQPKTDIWLYRDPPVEGRVPFELDILHQDENLVVVDKPHFLATTPRGAHIVESALVRLRRDLDIAELSPIHRLDRITAGVLIFTVRQPVRRAYQELFRERAVTKQYEALARVDQNLELPRTVYSRIVKERGVLKAAEVEGEPNAETRVELIGTSGSLGRYLLHAKTGKTHQLRIHMAGLGIPIVGDNFYPDFYDVAPDDYSNPLQLLARSIEFIDPFTAELRRFESRRQLGLSVS